MIRLFPDIIAIAEINNSLFFRPESVEVCINSCLRNQAEYSRSGFYESALIGYEDKDWNYLDYWRYFQKRKRFFEELSPGNYLFIEQNFQNLTEDEKFRIYAKDLADHFYDLRVYRTLGIISPEKYRKMTGAKW